MKAGNLFVSTFKATFQLPAWFWLGLHAKTCSPVSLQPLKWLFAFLNALHSAGVFKQSLNMNHAGQTRFCFQFCWWCSESNKLMALNWARPPADTVWASFINLLRLWAVPPTQLCSGTLVLTCSSFCHSHLGPAEQAGLHNGFLVCSKEISKFTFTSLKRQVKCLSFSFFFFFPPPSSFLAV